VSNTASAELLRPPQPLFEGQVSLAMIQELAKELQVAATSEKSRRKVSKYKTSEWWAVMERFSKPEYSSVFSRTSALKNDLDHIKRENFLAEIVTRFSYQLEVKAETLFGPGYQEEMSFLLNTFAQELARRGLGTFRGLTEAVVFQKINSFLSHQALQLTEGQQPQEQQWLLLTSPPDHKEAGYHGTTSLENHDAQELHHSFTFGIRLGKVQWEWNEATQRNEAKSATVEVTQFRHWPNFAELLELQKELGSPLTIDPQIPLTNQIIANVHELAFPTNSTPESIEAAIQKTLYQPEKMKDWGRNPEQVPKFAKGDLEKLLTEETVLFEQFFLPHALGIFEEITPELLNNRRKAKRMVKHLELLFQHYSGALEKRVRELNVNPAYEAMIAEQERQQPLLRKIQQFIQSIQIFLARDKTIDPEENRPLPNKIKDLNYLYYLSEKTKIFHKPLSKEERKWYFNNIGSLLNLSGFAFGLAQCIVLTPFSLPLNLMREGLNMKSLGKFESALNMLSIEQKREFYDVLVKEEMIELDLLHKGAKQIWMVPKSFLEGDGCEVDPATGRVWGPCTDETGQRIYIDDPRFEQLSFAMTKQEYEKFIDVMKKNIEESEMKEIEDFMMGSPITPEEKQKAQSLLHIFQEYFFLKTQKLSDFIAGSDPLKPVGGKQALKQVFLRLKLSPLPVKELEIIVQELLTSAQEDLKEALLIDPVKALTQTPSLPV
jgi:hypothetical protein